MLRRLLLALALVVAGPAIAAQQDWTKTVAVTPEGGYRMGNPQAPVKLVEYGSLTCPHCAHFAQQGVPQILPQVRSGRVSYELRNFVRDPADMAAALLSHCAAPAAYFGLTDRIFSSQEQWIGKLTSLPEDQQKQFEALSPQQRIARMAQLSGLDKIAAEAGVTPARANACLADPKALDKLLAIRKVAVDRDGLEGTPTFLLNGKRLADVYDWTSLQPHLAAGK